MACISMGLHPNHVIYGLFCRQEAELQIISPLLSIILTYTCAVLNAMKNNKTLQWFCGSLYDISCKLVNNEQQHILQCTLRRCIPNRVTNMPLEFDFTPWTGNTCSQSSCKTYLPA